jgi:phosphomannomutase / phosphoglucomutase
MSLANPISTPQPDMATVPATIFREYDIRGLAGTELTPDTARAVGIAFAVFLTDAGVRGPIAIGRDNRPSGSGLHDALVSALTASGLDVLDVGVVPTPALYWSLQNLGVGGGVQITASHNPAPYNGFKMCVGTRALFGEEIQQLLTIIRSGRRVTGQGTVRSVAILDRYLDDIVQRIGGPLTRPMRIALDCANGVGSLVGPQLMQRLGVTVTACLLCESDGTFPRRQPDPSQAKNLADLIAAVRTAAATGAPDDAGIAVDGDADRIGVVDGTGEIVWGDRVLAIYARDVLANPANHGAPIIFDVKSSQALEEAIRSAGGTPVMWKTGHSLIESKMQELRAPLAGELSGHMYIADGYYGFDDALYAAARLLRIMATSGKTLTELLAGVPVYPISPELRIHCADEVKFEIVKRAVAHWSVDHSVVTVDGARINFGEVWGLIRASNTEPALVLRFEGRTEARLAAIRGEMETWLAAQGVPVPADGS